MKTTLCAALAALLLTLVPAAAQPPKVYSTGRVEPKRLKALLAESDNRHAAMLAALPTATDASFDCSKLLGPVKDQGQCGSCWDFSGVCVVEGAYGKLGKSFVLSEQYVLDCGRNGGCEGDDNTSVLKDAKDHGLPLSSAYGAYHARTGRCVDQASLTKYTVKDWGFCDGSGQGVTPTQKVKDCMKQFGPIGAAIAADDKFMNVRPNEVFDGRSKEINHDIVLVGWDDAKGAWRLRNSWGTSWCDGGYCWIKYGANSVGTEAVFAFVEPQPEPAPGPGPAGGHLISTVGYFALVLAVLAAVFFVGRLTKKESKP